MQSEHQLDYTRNLSIKEENLDAFFAVNSDSHHSCHILFKDRFHNRDRKIASIIQRHKTVSLLYLNRYHSTPSLGGAT